MCVVAFDAWANRWPFWLKDSPRRWLPRSTSILLRYLLAIAAAFAAVCRWEPGALACSQLHLREVTHSPQV